MRGWTSFLLSEITSKIIDCEHMTAPTQEKGYPSIRTPNIGRGRLILENVNRVSEETYEIWTRRAKPQHPDLILAREAPLGNVAIIPRNLNVCLGQRTVLLSPDLKKVDPYFLCYRLLSNESQNEMISRGGGSTVPHLNVKEIRNLPISIPPLPTQRRIASILSAYDDLIENNLRRIKLLEELAQRTYEEWFVKFTIDGKKLPVSEETGLPEGWETSTCFDVLNVLSGGTPKTSEGSFWNGDIQFFTPKDASASTYTNGTEKTITVLGLGRCNSKLYPKNTIFITARGTVGKINLASESMAMNQSCYALIGKNNISQFFLFSALKNIVNTIKVAANGGVFDTIVVDTFKYLPFRLPSRLFISKFDDFVMPIFAEVLNLQTQNRLLKESRDILLPRLMGGNINLEETEVQFAMAAEPKETYKKK